jgi:signal transduction histidine kinase
MTNPAETPSDDSWRRQYAEIATLAGGLAHEIRNPLSTIRLNLELLGEDLASLGDPKQQRMLKKLGTIQKECLRLEDVLNAFLQFARAGEIELHDTDLGEVVRDFIEFYRAEADRAGIVVSPHLASGLPRVKLDRNLLRQVLVNLARNAQQAMPEGGTLNLMTYADGRRVCLDVIDTGCGIKPQSREKIFEVFYSTRPGGSGLGLPTVRKIVEAHGGTIECQSEPGKGTRFTLSFPPA